MPIVLGGGVGRLDQKLGKKKLSKYWEIAVAEKNVGNSIKATQGKEKGGGERASGTAFKIGLPCELSLEKKKKKVNSNPNAEKRSRI